MLAKLEQLETIDPNKNNGSNVGATTTNGGALNSPDGVGIGVNMNMNNNNLRQTTDQ